MLQGLPPNEGTLEVGGPLPLCLLPLAATDPPTVLGTGPRAKGQGGAAREAWSPVPDSGVGDVQTC